MRGRSSTAPGTRGGPRIGLERAGCHLKAALTGRHEPGGGGGPCTERLPSHHTRMNPTHVNRSRAPRRDRVTLLPDRVTIWVDEAGQTAADPPVPLRPHGSAPPPPRRDPPLRERAAVPGDVARGVKRTPARRHHRPGGGGAWAWVVP